MSTPTSRTLAWLRGQGYTAQVVERFNIHAKVRVDLFGCIDVVAIGNGQIIGVQACAGASHAARKAKALAIPALRTWVECGGTFWVVSWSKRGPRGKRKVWTERAEEVDLGEIVMSV